MRRPPRKLLKGTLTRYALKLAENMRRPPLKLLKGTLTRYALQNV